MAALTKKQRSAASKKAAATRKAKAAAEETPEAEFSVKKGDVFYAAGMGGTEFKVKSSKDGVVVLANDHEEVISSVDAIEAGSWIAA